MMLPPRQPRLTKLQRLHDRRNALTVIHGRVALLRRLVRDQPEAAKAQRHLDAIDQMVHEMMADLEQAEHDPEPAVTED